MSPSEAGQLALDMAAISGEAKDKMQALGLTHVQMVRALMVDAVGGAVVIGIPREILLKMVDDEYTAAEQALKDSLS